MEKEVNGKVPCDEGAEVQSPKRKVIRVESEETQDHVRESLNLSQEEAEEISFVPLHVVSLSWKSTAFGGAQPVESAQQVTGGTNRCQCQSGKGFRVRHRKVCVKI